MSSNLPQQTDSVPIPVLLTNYSSQVSLASKNFPLIAASVTPTMTTLRTSPVRLRGLAAFIGRSTAIRAAALVDIAVTDRLGLKGRFSIKYLFLSTLYSSRLTTEVYGDETTTIPSLANAFYNQQRIFASAGWLEREVWDLFGIYFTENGDLRRILTDYGFTGHPLRKDFPLTGFHELVYNDAEGRVTIEPVELAQELRVFHL